MNSADRTYDFPRDFFENGFFFVPSTTRRDNLLENNRILGHRVKVFFCFK